MTKDAAKLRKALNTIKDLTAFEEVAARILLQVNGIDNALEYVEGIKQRRSKDNESE